MQDIEIGFPEFDKDFVIKVEIEHSVKELLQNTRIRELMERQPLVPPGSNG